MITDSSINATPRGILVVERDCATRELLRLVLSEANFVVYVAENKQEAVELCREHRPALLLVELNLSSNRGGLQLLVDLRAIHPAIRCCLVSGGLCNYSDDEFRRLGVAHFFTKPFTMDNLTQTLERIISGPHA